MSFWDQFVEELRALGQQIGEWAVLVLVAILVLIVGRFVLGWVRRLVERLLGVSWLEGVWERSGIKGALETSNQTAASITATVLYAYLMIALWLIIARILSVDTIENLLERLLLWVPQAILAAFIVIVAAAAARWTADLVAPFARDRGVSWLAGVVRIAILIFGIVFALDVVDITFAEDVVKIFLAAVGIALAVAFGVGGIDTAKQWWSRFGSPSLVSRQTGGPTRHGD